MTSLPAPRTSLFPALFLALLTSLAFTPPARAAVIEQPFPARAANAVASLDGAWLRTERDAWGTHIVFTHRVWFFTASGRFARAPVGGFDSADFTRTATTPHRQAGNYRIEVDNLILDWVGTTRPTALSFALLPDGTLRLDGLICARVRPLPTDWRLEGSYEGGASGGSAATSSTYTFRADGTYRRDRSTSANSSDITSIVSSGATAQKSGTYAFSGHALTLTDSAAATRTYTVAAVGSSDASGRPEYLYLDGGLLKRGE